MSRTFLYRRLGSAVIIVALFAWMAPRSAAQGRPQLKRPEQGPEEKPPEPKKKKVKGPRALGILQLGSGKTTLIPVAILVDGKFYDASAYKADPVPMALESGTVYEVEQTGDSQGLFTVSGALHSKSPGSPNPWVANGSFLPAGKEAPKTTRKAEDVPVGLDNSGDEPPRLTKKTASASASSPAPTASAPAGKESPEKTGAAGQPASGSSGGSSGGDNPKGEGRPADKPTDQTKTGDPSAKTQSPSKPAEQTSPGQASQAPSSSGAASPAQAPQGEAVQESENYYRPTLRRGKPTQAAPEEDEATPKAANPESAANAVTPAKTEPVQLIPAVSDADGPDPRPYKFFWKEGEEDERRKQMLTLAADEVRAYATALARNQIPARPANSKATAMGHKREAKSVQPVFENIQFRAFDVWGNNQPVMILSAEAHFPPVPGAGTAPELYNVTLVSKTDIYGNLRKLYSGVTDKFHLDVTPRLELIDAVDADGDGRGELLFRETSDAGSGYVIYRATADKLWKMFDGLSRE